MISFREVKQQIEDYEDHLKRYFLYEKISPSHYFRSFFEFLFMLGGLRGIYEVSPYHLKNFDQMLKRLTSDVSFKVISMEEYLNGNIQQHKINVVLRHDIDTKKCLGNLFKMIKLEDNYNIHSSVYFRMDNQEYSPEEAAKVVRSLKTANIEIGFHTLAHIKEDPLEAFVDEMKKFKEIFGYPPHTFTIHGVFPRPNNDELLYMRMVNIFINLIRENRKKIGNIKSDSLLPHYNYVIQDCYTNNDRTYRYLQNDWKYIKQILYQGETCLILTHPCYWE